MNAKRKRLMSLALVVTGVIGILVLILFKGPLAPIEVQTVRLAETDLRPALFGVGTLEARHSYSIGPTRTGRLLELLVDHGDAVATGQLLGEMDPVDLPDRLRSAQLSFEKTKHLLAAAQARVDEAQSQYAQAKRDAKRYKDLLKKQQISKELAEAKETEARSALDQIHVAEAELAGTQHDLERLQSDVKALQRQIDELSLISPVDGLVTAREVEPGSVIVAGTPVLRLIDPKTLWVRTRIEQRSGGDIVLGLPAEVRLRSLPDTPLAGQVARVELIADSLTEERWVDVSLNQTPANQAIGMLANVTLFFPAISQAQWLPAAAIQYRDRKAGVWLVENGKARFAEVKLGTHTLDGKFQILSGIASDDQVISYSSETLSEGQRVSVRQHD